MPERETGCCVNVSGMSAQDVSRLSSLGGSIRSLPRVPARGYACKLLWVKKGSKDSVLWRGRGAQHPALNPPPFGRGEGEGSLRGSIRSLPSATAS